MSGLDHLDRELVMVATYQLHGGSVQAWFVTSTEPNGEQPGNRLAPGRTKTSMTRHRARQHRRAVRPHGMEGRLALGVRWCGTDDAAHDPIKARVEPLVVVGILHQQATGVARKARQVTRCNAHLIDSRTLRAPQQQPQGVRGDLAGRQLLKIGVGARWPTLCRRTTHA